MTKQDIYTRHPIPPSDPILVSAALSIVINQPEYLPFFESLNKAWIEKDFELEPDDLYMLGNAQEAIVDRGGTILYAVDQGEVTGTVALVPITKDEFKMIKMAVDERHRRKGTGRLLILSAIAKAKEMGAKKLILYSNAQANAPAVRLYGRLGFLEVPLTDCRYKRANIKMEIQL